DPDADATVTVVVRTHQPVVFRHDVRDRTRPIGRANDWIERVGDVGVAVAATSRVAVWVNSLAEILDVVDFEIVVDPEMEPRRRPRRPQIDVDVLEEQP